MSSVFGVVQKAPKGGWKFGLQRSNAYVVTVVGWRPTKGWAKFSAKRYANRANRPSDWERA